MDIDPAQILADDLERIVEEDYAAGASLALVAAHIYRFADRIRTMAADGLLDHLARPSERWPKCSCGRYIDVRAHGDSFRAVCTACGSEAVGADPLDAMNNFTHKDGVWDA